MFGFDSQIYLSYSKSIQQLFSDQIEGFVNRRTIKETSNWQINIQSIVSQLIIREAREKIVRERRE